MNGLHMVQVYADCVSDGFEQAYAPWPMRFYIMVNGRLAYLNQPSNFGEYSISGVRDWLLQHALA